MGGFHKCGYSHSWMVYFMENTIKMDDDWGYHYFRKPPNMYEYDSNMGQ